MISSSKGAITPSTSRSRSSVTPVRTSTNCSEGTVTISNTGGQALGVGQLQIMGADSARFSLLNDTCSSSSVAPAASCTLQLVYAPTVEASHQAELAVISDDPDSPSLSIVLTGTGSDPNGGNVDPSGFPVGSTLELDLGGAGTTTAGFNNLGPMQTAITELVTDNADVTNVNLLVTSAFASHNQSGSATNSVGIPGTASSDTLWLSSGQVATLRVSNLNPSSQYSLTLFASRSGNDSGNGRLTRYTINGSDFLDLDAASNTSEAVVFTGVIPDTDGSITINVQASPDGSARYAYLGYLSIVNQGQQ